MARSSAPLDRSIIDAVRPILRILLGLLLIGFSATSTIRIAADDLGTYFDLGNDVTLYLIEDRYWYAIVLALVIVIGELATGEANQRAYVAFLMVDSVYTARGVFDGVSNIFVAALGPSDTGIVAGVTLAIIASVILGALVAYYGEIVLFGPRKAGRMTK